MRKEIIRTVEAVLVFLILAIGFYPAVSNAWNSFVASKMITHYQNQSLRNAGVHGEDDIFQDENGVIGYLEVPSISLILPIYEGTSDEVLEKGVGHLESSSLPVGGAGTHTILTGHRGLPSAKLFTDLDKLAEGDRFMIHSSGKRLVYEVDDIRTVLPHETKSLRNESGKDLATLVTCTPYGVNTHRLLVTGERVADRNDTAFVDLDLMPDDPNKGPGLQWGVLKNILILAAAAAVSAGTAVRVVWIWGLDWPRDKRRIRRAKWREMQRNEERIICGRG